MYDAYSTRHSARSRAVDINWIAAWHKRINGAARARRRSFKCGAFNVLSESANEMDTRAGTLERRTTEAAAGDKIYTEGLLRISFALAIFLCLFALPNGKRPHWYFWRFRSRAAVRAFSLLSKCVESDYAVYTKRDVESRKTASFDDIGYSRYRPLSGYAG